MVGEASAVFGGGATTGRRETGATGAGRALVGAARGGGALGTRGVERRERGALGADNGAGGGGVRAAIFGRGGGATDGFVSGAARVRGLGVEDRFAGGGGATWRAGGRAGSKFAGRFSFDRGMLRGGGANNSRPPPPSAVAGRRAMTGREGRGAVFRYKSGRFGSGPSASSALRSTLTVGLPY